VSSTYHPRLMVSPIFLGETAVLAISLRDRLERDYIILRICRGLVGREGRRQGALDFASAVTRVLYWSPQQQQRIFVEPKLNLSTDVACLLN
jgi:hypothetical protein